MPEQERRASFRLQRTLLIQLFTSVLVAVGLLAVGPASAAHAATSQLTATTSACAAHPSAANCDGAFATAEAGDPCTSGTYYVVASAPLTGSNSGSSYSNGYVQLWWSQTCQSNWTRIVVEPAGTWLIEPTVYVSSGSPSSESAQWTGGPGAYISPMIYAPTAEACSSAAAYPSTGGNILTGVTGQYTTC